VFGALLWDIERAAFGVAGSGAGLPALLSTILHRPRTDPQAQRTGGRCHSLVGLPITIIVQLITDLLSRWDLSSTLSPAPLVTALPTRAADPLVPTTLLLISAVAITTLIDQTIAVVVHSIAVFILLLDPTLAIFIGSTLTPTSRPCAALERADTDTKVKSTIGLEQIFILCSITVIVLPITAFYLRLDAPFTTSPKSSL